METTSSAQDMRAPLRFSLRTMLAITAGVCLLLVPYRWFGPGYLVSAVASATLFYACLRAYKRGSPAGALFAAGSGICIGFVLAIGLLVFFLHALANFVAVAIGAAGKLQPRGVAALMMLAAAVVYGWAFKEGYARHRDLVRMQDKYPIESLEPRLKFEAARVKNSPEAPSENSYSPAVLTALQASETSASIGRRPMMLERLHTNTRRDFVRAAGFGNMRMGSLSEYYLASEPRSQITLPVRVSGGNPFQGDPNDVEVIHNQVLADFLDPDDRGYVPEAKRAAGFESHGFRTLAEDDSDCPRKGRQWQLTRLELVSLLRHDPPRAYTSDTLPAMDQLEEFSHRALDAFEADALRQLEYQQDIVVDHQGSQIRMLGALRAGNDCLQCHAGNRGRLLGAFSYELVKIPKESDPAL